MWNNIFNIKTIIQLIILFSFFSLIWGCATTGCITGDCVTGKGTYIWADGDQYNGDQYIGDWVNGNRTGKGTYIWANGDKYVGDWANGNRTGKGTYIGANGTKYVGDYVNDKGTGKGTCTWANGDKYVGDWANGNRTGKGTCTWANGDKYVGDFVDNKQNGKGTYTLADGTKYVGDWVNGKKIGKGTLTWANGDKYAGSFNDELQVVSIMKIMKDSQAECIGLLKGDVVVEYDGSPISSKEQLRDIVSKNIQKNEVSIKIFREGKEKMYMLKGGDIGIEVSSSVKHGKVVFISAGGSKWELQEWDNGKKISTKTACKTLPEREWVYFGNECRKGLAHGKGEAMSIDASIFLTSANFRNGKLVQGTEKLDDDTEYIGPYKDVSKHGKGIIISNGQREKCEYSYGRRIDALHLHRLEMAKLQEELRREMRELELKRERELAEARKEEERLRKEAERERERASERKRNKKVQQNAWAVAMIEGVQQFDNALMKQFSDNETAMRAAQEYEDSVVDSVDFEDIARKMSNIQNNYDAKIRDLRERQREKNRENQRRNEELLRKQRELTRYETKSSYSQNQHNSNYTNSRTSYSYQPKNSQKKKKQEEYVKKNEALCYCWPKDIKDINNLDEKTWRCDGPIQKQQLHDGTLRESLNAVGGDDANYFRRRADFRDGFIMFCEFAIENYDRDISNIYNVPEGILIKRKSFKCKKNQVAYRCRN